MTTRNIAIIPARGGSKRIPRKNIKPFCGRPVISYAIAEASASGVFDRIVVSTDSKEIATVAADLGAEVPFLRPANLSDDQTATVPVIRHAIEELETQGYCPDNVCCVYPASPLIRAEDIRLGLAKLEESDDADFVFPVTTFPFQIFRALRIENGRVGMFWPDNETVRSQDLEEAWHDAGQFYWGRSKAWLTSDSLYSERSVPLPIPRYRVQDVDTQEDWVRAEIMYQSLQRNGCQ